MNDLLTRLTAAQQGSRDLDGDIAEALHLNPEGSLRSIKRGSFITKNGSLWSAPNYTTSLDAAITLVPAGAVVTLIIEDGLNEAEIEREWNADTDCWFGHHAKSICVALCIAALRAHDASDAATEN